MLLYENAPRLADSILYCFSTGCAFLFIIDCILYIYVKAYIVHRLYILTMRQKTIKQKKPYTLSKVFFQNIHCNPPLFCDMLIKTSHRPTFHFGESSEEHFAMNVLFSSMEYDFHSLIKVAEMAGLVGVIGFHQAGDDYLLTFPDIENVEKLVEDYKARLHDLENNVWSH